jgi:hypothetical protein
MTEAAIKFPVHTMLRGHKIVYTAGKWLYSGTMERTRETRECGFCHEHPVNEHDACIANLPGVANACCGHGIPQDAYIQFDDRICVRGEAAIVFFLLEKP